MNKYTYPAEPLTWSRLLKIIEGMTPEQKEREVLGYGYFSPKGYLFVSLRKVLITDESDAEMGDPDQPVLLW
jgi:hypothetical protein